MTSSCNDPNPLTGLGDALISEIVEKHAELIREMGRGNNDYEDIISLRGLPMTKADIAALDEHLGIGEVSSSIDAAGKSHIWETAFCGVWRVRHFGNQENIVIDDVVICAIPQILIGDKEDIKTAGKNLREMAMKIASKNRELSPVQ